MELPSILRDLGRVFLEHDKQEPETPKNPKIFLKWNHLNTDDSTLLFIRHYEFQFAESADRFLMVVLQSSHDKSMNIDIHKEVKTGVSSVIVSVSKTFFEIQESKVEALLDWIENEYIRATIDSPSE
jgi:hypothetical protein